MRPFYCVYDKSLRGGSHYLHVPAGLALVAKAAYESLVTAAPSGFEPIRWPDLHGGVVVVDQEWSCVYRFVEGVDRSSRPRPLNVVLMAIVKTCDIRGRDWRGLLTGTAFREMAARALAADLSQPESCCEDVTLPELTVPGGMAPDLFDKAADGMGDECLVCAVVSQVGSSGPRHLLITEQNGRRSFRVVNPVPPRPTGQSSQFGLQNGSGVPPLCVGQSGASESGNNSRRWSNIWPFVKAALLLAIAVPVAIVVSAWLTPSPKGPLVGQWYRLNELKGAGKMYQLSESDGVGIDDFRFGREEEGKYVLISRYGEERRVPRKMIRWNTSDDRDSRPPIEHSPPTRGDGTAVSEESGNETNRLP